MVDVTNSGPDPLEDVFVYFGDHFDGGGNDSPGLTSDAIGVYPETTWPGLDGSFSFTHEGGVVDASRYLGDIAPGETLTQYWLVSYPVLDQSGDAVWGAQSDPSDDLVLDYDVWATADPNGVVQEEVINASANMRNEITAMANKIWPNTDSKVPNEYLDAIEQQLGWGPDQIAPGLAVTQGIWYDMGNVNQGFDNDGDSVPDYNVWMQPVGDASVFDASAWRLAQTYGLLIVKLNDGTEQLIAFQDQLYHSNIPANNTGVVGLAYYAFAPIGFGAGTLTPYQEAASGSDNEKYNGDYGTYVGGPEGTPPLADFSKTGDVTVAPGDEIDYVLTATVPPTASSVFGLSQYGAPAVIADSIPEGTEYVFGTAVANNALPSGVDLAVLYSTDSGTSWSDVEPASGTTDLQWWLSGPIEPGEEVSVTFSTLVPSTYLVDTGTQVDNCAGIGLGGGGSLYTDCQQTELTGTLSIAGLVWQDDGGGTFTGDTIRQGSETDFIGAITVTLYPDADGDGLLSADESAFPRAVTESVAAGGAWEFTGLPDGDYIVQVQYDDPDRPTGYTLSTDSIEAVTLAGADASGFEFGFSPTLDLDKYLLSPGPYLEGTEVTYGIDVSNLTKPGDFLSTQAVVHELWLESTAGTFSGTGNAVGAPDGVFATAGSNGSTLSGNFLTAPVVTPVGAVAKVEAVIELNVSGAFSSDEFVVTVQQNGTDIGTVSLTETSLSAFMPSTGLVTVDVTELANWAWSDFSQTNTGLTLEISGGGGVPTFNVDALGYRVTTGSAPSETGNVFWTDADAELKSVPPSVVPADELNVSLSGLADVPQEIAFDELNRHVFLGYSSGLIERRELDGSNPLTVATGQSSLSGLAVDSVHGYVYWTRAGNTDEMHRANTDGTGAIAPLGGLADPAGVAVDPYSAKVYWVQTQGSSLQIRRADLDFTPSSVVDLFSPTVLGSGNHNPTDLEIDTVRRKLYWSDDKSGSSGDFVGVVNLDGTGLAILVPGSDPNSGTAATGVGINLDTGTVYWSDNEGIHQVTAAGVTSTLVNAPLDTTGIEIAGDFKFIGSYDANKTLVTVPLVDTYDPTEMRFVSSSLAPTAIDDVAGVLSWDNVGPIHPRETQTIEVTFELLEPPGNATNVSVDNTVDVVGAVLANQLPANDGNDDVLITVDPTASIGDRVWSNIDGDGIQEPGGDDGAPVAVTLTADDPSGNPGHYSFVDLVTGPYFVEFEPTPAMKLSAANIGGDEGVDSDADTTTGLTGLRNVLPGGSVTAVDAGVYGLGEIGDRIWHDVNRDGLQTADEPAINGIELELVWPGPDGVEGTGDDISLFTVTEPGVTPDGQEGGTYSFPNLFEGDYRIVATQPLGSVPTYDEDGGNDNTSAVSVSAGDSLTVLDFGFTGTGGLSGYVIVDMDQSDSVSERDLGIGGATILLTGVDIYGGNVVRETTTNSIGFYNFADLLPGHYELVELQPGEFVDDADFTGDLGGAVGGNDRFESVVVDVDQFGALYNFTESIAPSMVSKRLFLGNANGSLFAIPGTQRLTNYDLQNPVSAADVHGDTNADGLVTALDALRVLNSLQRIGGSGSNGAEGEAVAGIAPRAHLDVNRDGSVTTIDVLSVLNVLATQLETEGEFSPIHEEVWEESADHFMANHEQDEDDALLELLAFEASKTQG